MPSDDDYFYGNGEGGFGGPQQQRPPGDPREPGNRPPPQRQPGGQQRGPRNPRARGRDPRAPRDSRVTLNHRLNYDELKRESLRPELPWWKKVVNDRRFRIIAPIAAVLVITLIVFSVVMRQIDPPGPQGKEVAVTIKKGGTFTSLTNTLVQAGVSPNATGLKIWSKLNGVPPVQEGEYTFRRNSSAAQVFAVLRGGAKQKLDRITVPEGKRLTEVAEIVGALPGMSRERFLEIAKNNTIRSQFQPPEVKSLEGYLYPDTYEVGLDANEESLIRTMVNVFDNKARAFGLDNAQKSIGRSSFEALTIASLIEGEAKMSHDRAKVSQVVENRLAQNMALQFDSSVAYGLGKKAGLTVKDLKTDGPYNSYTRKGLPPGPICNPGEASIRAALAPEPGPWLFFVVIKNDGTTAFSETNAQHEANKAIAKKNGVVL